jgi:hypothetical protein
LNFGSVLKKTWAWSRFWFRFGFVGKPRFGLLQISCKTEYIVDTSYYCVTMIVVCHLFLIVRSVVLDAGAECYSSARL